jgi:DNA ligase-1
MSTFKPLLAEKADLDNLKYPVFTSPKYDGFRCLINQMGLPVSRNLKPIPNIYVQAKLAEMKLPQFDGELLTYTGNKLDDFNTIQSKLTRREGLPEFRYMIFDHWASPQSPYETRLHYIKRWFDEVDLNARLHCVKQTYVDSREELDEEEAIAIEHGWEGLMIRSLDGKYKFGRSTTKEGILLKLKRFEDSEGEIIGFEELKHNANEATTNELGYTERSSHKANMIGMDTLGKLKVGWGIRGKSPDAEYVEFDLGTGFTASQRADYWSRREELLTKKVKFKYQGVGPNGKPRFPVFLGFRDLL